MPADFLHFGRRAGAALASARPWLPGSAGRGSGQAANAKGSAAARDEANAARAMPSCRRAELMARNASAFRRRVIGRDFTT